MKLLTQTLFKLIMLPIIFTQLLVVSGQASQVALDRVMYGANSSVNIDFGYIDFVTGCPSNGINDIFYPWADIYVVPKGVSSGKLTDVSNPKGIPNTLQYFSIGDTIANTGPGGYLISGDYAVVINECQNGTFLPDKDTYGPEFSVRIPANIDPLQSAAFASQLAAVKSSADKMGEQWLKAAGTCAGIFRAFNVYTAYSIMTDPGDFLLFACTNIDYTGNRGMYCSLNDAWGGLLSLEKAVVDYIKNQANFYKGIAADPPDSNFKELSVLDQGLKVDISVNQPGLQSALKFGELASQEQAMTHALLHALERYQGAQQDNYGEYAYVQAREIEKQSRALAGLVGRTSTAFQTLANDANASGVDFVTIMNNHRTTQARVKTSGLTAMERTKLKAAGWTDAQIDAGVTGYIAMDFSGMQSSDELTVLAGKIASEAAIMNTALTNLADVMVTAQANLASQLRLPFPKANAGGPYVVNAGTPLNLTGSVILADPNSTPSYSWDFNLDGVFDDATGQTPTTTFNRDYDGYVGMKVTLPNGYYDISYARLTVNKVNSSPNITSASPAGTVSIQYTGSQVFLVTASDPDGDPITYSWDIDGIVIGTGPSLTYNASMDTVGEHIVTVTVDDNSPLSPPTSQMWRMTVIGYNPLDCNGLPLQVFYRDADNDGLGDPAKAMLACTTPSGYVANSLDCNDNDPNIGSTTVAYYRDADGDGFGNPLVTIQACSAPTGYVANSLDCNDSDPAVGNILSTFYRDADGDGYGNISVSVQACFAPTGFVTNGLDCNDANPYINPGRKEVVHNGKDDDCSVTTPDNWSKSFILSADDSGYIYYARSNGDGTFSNYKQIMYIGGVIRGILIEDFNADGYLDFIVGRSDGTYLSYLNDGSDNFASQGVVAQHPYNGCWSAGISAGDFNNDGLIDFAANNGCSNITALFLNDGQGGFTRSTYTLPSTGRSLNVADVDGDGNLDFVVAMTGSNDIWLYKGDGSGSFTPSMIGTASGSASDNYALAAADFDNDGKVDIVLGGSSNGNPYFFKGNGNGTFQAPILVPSLHPGTHNAIDAYDLNNDGKVDIVLADYTGRTLWFYPGNGDGTFGARTQINTSLTSTNVLSIAAPPIGNPTGFPFADAEPKSQTVAVGVAAVLDGSFSIDPGGSIISYNWKFGDGGAATGAGPSHIFTSEGDFRANLLVTDNSGNKSTDLARVKVLGNPPVAHAGGPYTFGEQFASDGIYTVPLNGTSSTDDFGIATYAWSFNLFSDAFNGTTLDSSKWIASTGVTQNGTVSIVGANGWDTRYLFSQVVFPREDGLTFEIRVKPGTVDYQHAMFGVKNTSANYYYGQMAHAIYFAQGNLNIYEDGNNRGQVGTYTRGIQYDLKFVLKPSGARYYIRETGKPLYQLIYDSNYSNISKVTFGGTVYADSFEVDDVSAYSVVYGPTPGKLLLKGTQGVTLTVTDKAGQKASDATTISTVTGISPTSIPGGPYTFDETFANANNWTVTLDGSASNDDTGIETYSWNFGDGSALGSGAKPTHVYTGAGTYTVTLTVSDRSGQTNMATTSVTTKGNAFPIARSGGPYTVPESDVLDKHWNITLTQRHRRTTLPSGSMTGISATEPQPIQKL